MRNQPPPCAEGVEHVGDVVRACVTKAVVVEPHKHHQCHCKRGVKIVGGRDKTRHEAEEVTAQNEEGAGADHGDVAFVLVAENRAHHADDLFDDEFEHKTHRKGLAGHDGFFEFDKACARDEGCDDQKEHHQRRAENMVHCVKLMCAERQRNGAGVVGIHEVEQVLVAGKKAKPTGVVIHVSLAETL